MDKWLEDVKNDPENAQQHILKELERRIQKRMEEDMNERLRRGWFNEEPSGILSQESIDTAKSL